MGNFEEEINTLENTVKKLKTELEVEKNEKETLKKTSESKLEEQDKKIKVMDIGYFLCNIGAYGCMCILYSHCPVLVHNGEEMSVPSFSYVILQITLWIWMKLGVKGVHWNLSFELHFHFYRFCLTTTLHDVHIKVHSFS